MAEVDRKRAGRFGTFAGVFTPSVLTILGVIMFMRAGFVVGDSGIWRALLILAIAKTITGLTTLSLSAIATNTEVGTGGNYFMISRTLGPEVGGTIGITLFISQAVAIAFYVIGFSEALFGVLAQSTPGVHAWLEQSGGFELVSCAVIAALFVLTFKGADVALRAQFLILVILLASVAAFLIGGFIHFDAGNFEANSAPIAATVGFWSAFAIFFPAATGIDAGANMSGDLENPARSIPIGTFAAIGFTAVVYLLLLILLAGFTGADELVADPFGTLQRMSIFGPLVVVGVFAATLSSALSSFLGAPRILQAMGKDKLLRPIEYFARGHGPSDEPRRATVLSLVIAIAIVFAGGLDAIAEIISMFFLISYGMINLSAFVEGRAGNPSFRPRFRMFGWPAALVATCGCVIAMVKINETYAIVSMLLAGLIYLWLKGRVRSTFDDATRGYTFAVTRAGLLELDEGEVDAKNWRPILCAVSRDADADRSMLACAGWLESGRGLLSAIEIVDSELRGADRSAERKSREIRLRGQLELQEARGFAACVLASDGDDVIDAAIQSHSIGSLRPNTIMASLPPPDQTARRRSTSAIMRSAIELECNLVLYKGARRPVGRRRLDLWWSGERNGSLMALFAYLIANHPAWSGVKVRILRLVREAGQQDEARRSLEALMEAARIPAEIDVLLSSRSFAEVCAESSADADLVLLGLARRDAAGIDAVVANDPMLARLPATLLICSNGELDLLA